MTLEQRVEQLEKSVGIEQQKRYRVKSVHDIALWLHRYTGHWNDSYATGGSKAHCTYWSWSVQMWDQCGKEVYVWSNPDLSNRYSYVDENQNRYLPEWVE